MSGGAPSNLQPQLVTAPGVLGSVARLLSGIHKLAMRLSMLALIAACLVLATSVFLRYFLKVPTDWQDEVSVFLLVGATFLSSGFVQERRGHIGIEAVASLLPPSVNRLREYFCDLGSFAFCLFFTWKSWSLCYEAWDEGQTTSSSWAPSLVIPYGLMSLGMTLLTLQLLIQCVAIFLGPRTSSGESK